MRWRVVGRLHFLLMQGNPARPVPIPTKQRGVNVVPVWVCDLWQASKDVARSQYHDGENLVFSYRIHKTLSVVGKPGGVDPEEFSAALRLGGWEAAMQLHAELRPTVPANFPASLTK